MMFAPTPGSTEADSDPLQQVAIDPSPTSSLRPFTHSETGIKPLKPNSQIAPLLPSNQFSSVLNDLMRFLLQQGQPNVKQYIQRSGQTGWKIYDRGSGRSAYCATEQDVRIWLDKRFA